MLTRLRQRKEQMKRVSGAHLMLMLDLARAENMVAETPLRLAICCPTAASMQQLSMASMWWMRPDLMASLNLHEPQACSLLQLLR